METWYKLLKEALRDDGENWNDVIYSTLNDLSLHRKFDSGYGGSCGCAFTVWTLNRVYFSVVYNGAEWVESVPRNPCDEVTNHKGGE